MRIEFSGFVFQQRLTCLSQSSLFFYCDNNCSIMKMPIQWTFELMNLARLWKKLMEPYSVINMNDID